MEREGIYPHFRKMLMAYITIFYRGCKFVIVNDIGEVEYLFWKLDGMDIPPTYSLVAAPSWIVWITKYDLSNTYLYLNMRSMKTYVL